MQLYKKIAWTHEDKEYEIRILHDTGKITVAAFLNNHPANGFRYLVFLQKNSPVKSFLKMENFTHLVESAKADIINNHWQRFQIQ